MPETQTVTVNAYHPYPAFYWEVKTAGGVPRAIDDNYPAYQSGQGTKTVGINATINDVGSIRCTVGPLSAGTPTPGAEGTVTTDWIPVSVGALTWAVNPEPKRVTIQAVAPPAYEHDFDALVDTGDWEFTRPLTMNAVDGVQYHMRETDADVPVYPYAAWDETNQKFIPPTTAEKIGQEAVRRNPESAGDRRPLPLWSHWWPGETVEEDSCTPKWQTERIVNNGDYVLPVIAPAAGDTALSDPAFMGDYWNIVSSARIPIWARIHQPEHLWDEGTYDHSVWRIIPPGGNDSYIDWESGGIGHLDVEPTDEGMWYGQVPDDAGITSWWNTIVREYPDVSRIEIMSNNETGRMTWYELGDLTADGEGDGSQNYIDMHPGGTTDAEKKDRTRSQYNRLYALYNQGRRDNLSQGTPMNSLQNLDPSGYKLHGFKIGGAANTFQNSNWDQGDCPLYPDDGGEGLSQGSTYLPNGFDGMSENTLYLQEGGTSGGVAQGPYNDWATHMNIALFCQNVVPSYRYNMASNPQLHTELSDWTSGPKQAQYTQVFERTLSPETYYPVCLTGIWVLKPRVIRRFLNGSFTWDEQWCVEILRLLKVIWETPVIAKHWQYGEMVLRDEVMDGETYKPRYDENVPAYVASEPRWYLLYNNTDPDRSPRAWPAGVVSSMTQLPHISVASVIGEVGSRQWLLYTVSRDNITAPVTITIPDGQGGLDVTVSTDSGGKYFVINEGYADVKEVG